MTQNILREIRRKKKLWKMCRGQATEEYKAAEKKVKNMVRNAKRNLRKNWRRAMAEIRDRSLHTSRRKQTADPPLAP